MSLIERLAGLLPARRSLHIHLAPQGLLAAVRQGGRLVEGSALHIPCANPAAHWQPALAALRELLARPEAAGTVVPQQSTGVHAGRSADAVHTQPADRQAIALLRGSVTVHAALNAGAPLSITLSARWCQMLLAPWSDALLAEPGASQFLRTQLAAIYGDAATAWTVRSDDTPYGQPRLACGIATELLDALHALAAEHGTRCTTIEPLASAVCQSLAGKPQAFAIIEQGRMTLAALTGRRITAIQSQPCSAVWRAELPQAWQRWSLRVPELAAIGDIAVIDMSGQPQCAVADRLPSAFRMEDSPFGSAASVPGSAPATADTPHGGARNAGLPLSIVGGTSRREAA